MRMFGDSPFDSPPSGQSGKASPQGAGSGVRLAVLLDIVDHTSERHHRRPTEQTRQYKIGPVPMQGPGKVGP